jgi:hypothetical protein
MSEQVTKQKKSFFERMGEILNAPLPGTEAKPKIKLPSEIKEGDDEGMLARIREILNTPLPGSDTLDKQVAEASPDFDVFPEISEDDVQENWWETDWAEFKAHQEQDRKGLNMKQRVDQEDFARYQEQERSQFEAYQAKEFELFQAQQQAKLYWIQDQQMKAAMGEDVAVADMSGVLVPPPAPVAPLPPQMPTPPWMKTPAGNTETA